MTTTEDYAAHAAKRAAMAKLEAETLPQNKAALFDALAAAGISRVVVCFDGSGDAGQIESVTACAADDAEVALPGGACVIDLGRRRTIGWIDCSNGVIERTTQAAPAANGGEGGR